MGRIWPLLLAVGVSLSGCGGGEGGEDSPPPAPSYPVSGSVEGLTGTLVLRLNISDAPPGADIPITTNGGFTFPERVPEDQARRGWYWVNVLSQPSGQTCTASQRGAVDAKNVLHVSIVCTTKPPRPTYAVGGRVNGLTGVLVLRLATGGVAAPAELRLTTDGAFAFADKLTAGESYTINVQSQPSDQTCIVTNGHGAVGMSDVTDVIVYCGTPNTPSFPATLDSTNAAAVLRMALDLTTGRVGSMLFGIFGGDTSATSCISGSAQTVNTSASSIRIIYAACRLESGVTFSGILESSDGFVIEGPADDRRRTDFRVLAAGEGIGASPFEVTRGHETIWLKDFHVKRASSSFTPTTESFAGEAVLDVSTLVANVAFAGRLAANFDDLRKLRKAERPRDGTVWVWGLNSVMRAFVYTDSTMEPEALQIRVGTDSDASTATYSWAEVDRL